MPLGSLEQVAGLCLLTLILVDIFLTVLYARADSGLVAPHVGRVFWLLIRRISTVSRRGRERILALGGPLLVVAVVAMWFVGLSVGAALVIHPALGSGVKATGGETPTTFTAALLAGVAVYPLWALAGSNRARHASVVLLAHVARWHGGNVAGVDLLDAGLYGAASPQHRRVGR